ncbi:MAG: helix-turn-helix domain-containing protein [Alloprevotella sp.]
MTGKELKEKIAVQNISSLAIAKKLGISPQALNSTFNAADVKSGTLERIAEVLGVKMSFFYPNEIDKQSVVASGNGNVAGNNNVVGSVTIGDASVLQERVAMLERLLEEKERTIKILMEK